MVIDLSTSKLLKVEEVADILQLGRSTVYQMCKRKEIPHIAINHSIRIPAEALKEWIEKNIHLPEE